MNNLEIQELNELIEKKDITSLKRLLSRYPSTINDKDIFYNAIKTKNIFVVLALSDKLDSKLIDKNMINASIDSGIDLIVKSFCDKSDIQLDKESLSLAIEKANVKILRLVLEKTPNQFCDKEMFQKAVKTKNRDVLRLILNNIEERDFLQEKEKEIRDNIFRSDDIKTYIGQLLSIDNNNNKDYEYQAITFDIYSDVVINNHAKGKIHEKFPLESFLDSMNESKIFHSNFQSNDLMFLDKNNSFLIVPIYACRHAFSGIIRKLENSEKYSITLVNLGSMPHEKLENSDFTYVEYELVKKDVLNLLGKYSKNPRKNAPSVPVKEIYDDFYKHSLVEYTLNLSSRSQKLGNCFIKNTEKAIKFCLASEITKSLDVDFRQEILRKSHSSNEKNKVKFMKKLLTEDIYINDLDTLSLKRQLIVALENRLPQYKSECREVLNNYLIAKTAKQKKYDQQPRPMDIS